MAEYVTDEVAAKRLDLTVDAVRKARQRARVRTRQMFDIEELTEALAARPGRGSEGGRSRDARYGQSVAAQQRREAPTTR